MGQLACLEEKYHDQTSAITPGSCTCRSPCINTSGDPAEELDKFAGA